MKTEQYNENRIIWDEKISRDRNPKDKKKKSNLGAAELNKGHKKIHVRTEIALD